MQVFLDSNVLFSGLYSRHGAPNTILVHFANGKIDIVISPLVLREVAAAIKLKAPAMLPLLNIFLTATSPQIVPNPDVSSSRRWKGVLGADDAAILTAAISSGSEYLITGDKHFIKNPNLSSEAGIGIITPSEFIAILDR